MSRGPGRTFLYRFAVVLVVACCCWCLLFFVMVVGGVVVVVVGAASWCCGWLCCCIGGPHSPLHRFSALLLICPGDRVALFCIELLLCWLLLAAVGVCCSL